MMGSRKWRALMRVTAAAAAAALLAGCAGGAAGEAGTGSAAKGEETTGAAGGSESAGAAVTETAGGAGAAGGSGSAEAAGGADNTEEAPETEKDMGQNLIVEGSSGAAENGADVTADSSQDNPATHWGSGENPSDSVISPGFDVLPAEGGEEEASAAVLNVGSADGAEEEIAQLLASMTTDEKIAQLFFITPDALTGVSGTQICGDVTRERFREIPVGGFIFFEGNIVDPGQLTDLCTGLADLSEERIGVIPFLAVDEEGGTVLRIGDSSAFPVERVGDMRDIGDSGDVSAAYAAGDTIGTYLSEYGINTDFAPCADLLVNPDNYVVRRRSFGSDPALVSAMTAAFTRGLMEHDVCATLKHFPGHGGTTEDSHNGAAVSYRTAEELEAGDYLPFEAGMAEGADFVMAGHVSLPNVTDENLPASLSPYFLTEVLRGKLGFEGIVVTDALNMGAITSLYSSGDAAVAAFLAGADMILMPADFRAALSGVTEAVADGRISEERLNASVRRILRTKLRLMQQDGE